LERIKHISSIDGLFVILVFNEKFLVQSLKGIYGSASGDDNTGEHYFDKFIDSRILMYIPTENEYKKILKCFLIEQEVSDKQLADLLDDDEKTWYLCRPFWRLKLSLRQSKKACEEIAAFFKLKNWNISSICKEIFPYLVCKKNLNIGFVKYNQAYNSALVDGTRIDPTEAIREKEKNNDRRKIWENCRNYFSDKTCSFLSKANDRYQKFNLLSQYGLALAASNIQGVLLYDSLYEEVVAFATFLYKDEGVANQFAEAYFSEVFEMLEKFFK
jgi:hypothetical protein